MPTFKTLILVPLVPKTLMQAITVCKFTQNKRTKLEKGKKPSFGTNFGTLGLNLAPKIFFFRGFYLYYRPWHDVQIKKKEAWLGDEKPTLR